MVRWNLSAIGLGLSVRSFACSLPPGSTLIHDNQALVNQLLAAAWLLTIAAAVTSYLAKKSIWLPVCLVAVNSFTLLGPSASVGGGDCGFGAVSAATLGFIFTAILTIWHVGKLVILRFKGQVDSSNASDPTA